jgi:hypothetical protein
LFVVGSVAIVLLILGLYQESFLTQTYIIPGRWNVLLFLGILGAILALFRALLPPEHFVADPNQLMQGTHSLLTLHSNSPLSISSFLTHEAQTLLLLFFSSSLL